MTQTMKTRYYNRIPIINLYDTLYQNTQYASIAVDEEIVTNRDTYFLIRSPRFHSHASKACHCRSHFGASKFVCCNCTGNCGLLDDLRGMAEISQVYRFQVVVESFLGFQLVNEFLGFARSSIDFNQLRSTSNSDQENSAHQVPINRFIFELLSIFTKNIPRREWKQNSNLYQADECNYVVSSWCENGSEGWDSVLVCPDSTDNSITSRDATLRPEVISYACSGNFCVDSAYGSYAGEHNANCSSNGDSKSFKTIVSSAGKSCSVLVDIQFLCIPEATMLPDIIWNRLLNKWESSIAGLMYTNALLSTLGGGRFLCRQLGHAMSLARMQQRVADAIGDETLKGRCNVNEAYALVWLGQYNKANAIISQQIEIASKAENTDLLNFASVAQTFCRRAKAANKRLNLKRGIPLGIEGFVKDSARRRVQDDFHRVRAVDREAASVTKTWGSTNTIGQHGKYPYNPKLT